MNIHHMTLHAAPFEAIRAGRKTVELRLYDEKRRAVGVGDHIVFVRRDTDENRGAAEWLTARVRALHVFPDFAALYEALIPVMGAEALGYAPGEVAAPVDMERYYDPEEIERAGVVGIEIEVLD